MRKQIIYFGNDWSAENRTSSHHIATHLSRNNQILYVECPGLRAPKANSRDLLKIFKKLATLFKKPRKVSVNLTVFTLIQIPFHTLAVVSKFNTFLSTYLLRRVCKKLGLNEPILWFVVPHAGHLIGKINELMSVYYCIDDYSALPDVDVEAVKSMDLNLTIKVDVVFTASISLTNSKKSLNEFVYYSPHGVEFDHFNSAYKEKLKLPSDISKLKGPIVGFFGLIEAWIDLDLLELIVKSKPEYSLVLIGREAVDTSQLRKYNNVYFMGKREFSSLPSYASAFDVCILPYKNNDQIFNCNPIKLKEYLATGKPTVSVKFPEIMGYDDVLYLSDTKQEFVNNIALAISENSIQKSRERIAKVSSQTWENRVREIESIVDLFIRNKKN